MAEAPSTSVEPLTSVTGKISHIYHSKNHFWAGQMINEDTRQKMRFVGKLPDDFLHEGERWNFEGTWQNNTQYGRQFSIQKATLAPNQPLDLWIGFFSSSLFKGITKKHAHKIMDSLGDQAIFKLIEDSSVLTTTCGLTTHQAEAIHKGLWELHFSGKTISCLLKWGLSTLQIKTLSKFAKQNPEKFKRLGADPFYPYYYHSGFGYEGALRLADGFGLSDSDPRRSEAAIFQALSHSTLSQGGTYLPLEALRSLSHLSWSLICQGLELLESRDDLIVVDEERVYLKEQYEAEWSIALHLYEHNFPVEPISSQDFAQALDVAQKEQAIIYDDSQKAALELFLNSSLMILNGGPGTGKSTLLLGLLRVLGLLMPSKQVVLCAPTGRAAKRMAELTHYKARTIHSLLHWNWQEDRFEEGVLDCDILIVDEFSMVDARLFSELLKRLKEDCRLLIIGDEEQLESVGPGNVLSDLIASHKIPVANLKTLHRQKEGSGIPFLAQAIRDQESIQFIEPVQFLEALTSNQVLEGIKNLIQQEDNPEDIQFLAPMYGGESGIDEINAMIQEIINPFALSKPQLISSNKKENALRPHTFFRVGDKVLLTQNLLSYNVYNGDIGHIIDINPQKKVIQVDFGKQDPVEFDFKDESTHLSLLSHAWCISIHKSQGSEYPKACLIADQNGAYMLRKRLLYTGVSRAKKQLYIIGSKPLFIQGTRNQNSEERKTSLLQRIEEVWENSGKIPSKPKKEQAKS